MVGKSCNYVDELGAVHDALVTAEFEGDTKSVNLVFVSKNTDDEAEDGNRNLLTRSSIPHKDQQAAPGNYWYLPGG